MRGQSFPKISKNTQTANKRQAVAAEDAGKNL